MPTARPSNHRGILFATILTVFLQPAHGADKPHEGQLQSHVAALREDGQAPLQYVLNTLADHDLVLFDDALHNAVEPWAFYSELVSDPRFHAEARYVFLEIVPVNRQPALDAYFSTVPEDRTLLYPAFQDRYGWPYATYFDFLHTVYALNRGLEEDKKINVRAVSTPSYWKEIETPEDWANLNDRAVLGRDYDMYKVILADLGEFTEGKKGIFLTNTRHAYTDIRKPDGAPFWNTGTFFRQWHPNKSFSIRINAPVLKIENIKKRRPEGYRPTAEGLDRYEYSWARVAGGLWDAAFEHYGGAPVAIDLAGTAFGQAAYMGNHMHRAAPGQTMGNAYDGVIFLTPLEEQHSSAQADFIYTPAFKTELIRRYQITKSPEQIETLLNEAGVETLEAYIDANHTASPQTLSPQAQGVGGIDAWRGN